MVSIRINPALSDRLEILANIGQKFVCDLLKAGAVILPSRLYVPAEKEQDTVLFINTLDSATALSGVDSAPAPEPVTIQTNLFTL